MLAAVITCFVVSFVADGIGITLVVREGIKASRQLSTYLALNPKGHHGGSYAQMSEMQPVIRHLLGSQIARGWAVAALVIGLLTGLAGNLLSLSDDVSLTWSTSTDRDWLDWIVDITQVVGALGALIAIGFSVVAVKSAKQESARSNDRLIRERRTEFELETLRELGLMNTQDSNVSFATAKFKVLAASLGSEIVPLACASVGLDSTPEAKQLFDPAGGSSRDGARQQIETEILDAIRMRTSEMVVQAE